jgi:hypothetical protein
MRELKEPQVIKVLKELLDKQVMRELKEPQVI